MHFRFLNPFARAASSVLYGEFGIRVQPGNAHQQSLADTFTPVSMMLFCTGQQLRGTVLFATDKPMAAALLSRILDLRSDEVGADAHQAIAEFGSLIIGRAGPHLAEAGFQVDISPPTILIGEETLPPRLDVPGLVVPLLTKWGQIQVHVTLREVKDRRPVPANGRYAASYAAN